MQAREASTPTPMLLLASRSARRRRLLDEAGYAHAAVHPGFEDSVLAPGGVAPRQWIAALAMLKADAGARLPEAKVGGGRVVLAADTACLLDGRLVGTPRDAEEASAMLRAFRGREHEVLTGAAVIDLRPGMSPAGDPFAAPPRHVIVDAAKVWMGDVSDAQVREYVAGTGWEGKAGGYNLSEREEAGWPLRVEGDRTTVMGLPMGRLTILLDRLVGRAGAGTMKGAGSAGGALSAGVGTGASGLGSGAEGAGKLGRS